ncbi:LOW QUALITY PROTEIN: solute carrier family 22 member 20-like [Macrotis lagotis]|uniref:LOW QUALITY PROTEIN: solute carrier family 22 member 20-like n=1 Tax=Macrotis lagotis TaxID=92651 RepID=UPI003D680CB7
MGNFQILQTALMLIPGMLFICQVLLRNFSAMVPEHHCRLKNQTSNEYSFLGDDRDFLKVYIPMDKSRKPEMCLRFTDPQWQPLNRNATEQKPPTKTLYVILFCYFVLRFGRRTVMLWSSLIAMIAGTCTAFVTTFTGYVILKFLSGIVFVGTHLTRHCLVLEWIPTDKQILVSTCNGYASTLGQILLSGWAYLIREWCWLQFSTSIAYGIPFLLVLALPESALWLITHNKCHVAVKSLQKVAWINGHMDQGRKLTPEEIMSYIEEDLTTVKSRISLKDLFQTQAICKMTLCLMFAWFASVFSYYGAILDLQKFGFSIYLVQVLVALIDFPARLLAATGMSYKGQRLAFMFFAVFSGCLILIGIFIPQDMAALRLTFRVLGKGSLAAMIECLHLYSLKLYPTEIRQKGMCIASMGGSIGSILAPLVFIIGNYVPILQSLLFGIIPILSAIAASLLIETQGLPLQDTIQETENRSVPESYQCLAYGGREQSLKGNARQDGQERPALLIPEKPQAESTVRCFLVNSQPYFIIFSIVK